MNIKGEINVIILKTMNTYLSMDKEDSLDEPEGSDWSGCEDEEEDEDNITQSEVITDTFEDYIVQLPDII